MTDTPEKTQSATAAAAQRALRMKQGAAAPDHGQGQPGRRDAERAAAARAAARSKPALRKG